METSGSAFKRKNNNYFEISRKRFLLNFQSKIWIFLKTSNLKSSFVELFIEKEKE